MDGFLDRAVDPVVARLMGVGLTRPKAQVAGIDAAGVVVPKPPGLTFEQAAAVPVAATTALRGIATWAR